MRWFWRITGSEAARHSITFAPRYTQDVHAGNLNLNGVGVKETHFRDVSMASQLKHFVRLVFQNICSNLYLGITKVQVDTSTRQPALVVVYWKLNKKFRRYSKELQSKGTSFFGEHIRRRCQNDRIRPRGPIRRHARLKAGP